MKKLVNIKRVLGVMKSISKNNYKNRQIEILYSPFSFKIESINTFNLSFHLL